MAAPSPPSPPKGRATSVNLSFPPASVDTTVNNHINTNNANFALNEQQNTPKATNTKLDDEDNDVDNFDVEGDGDEDGMPRPRPQPVKREADLSIILTPAQMNDFHKLTCDIQDKVFEHISKATRFLDHPAAQAGRIKIWDFGPAVAAAQAKLKTEKPAKESENDIPSHPTNGEDGETEQLEKPEPAIKIDFDSVQPRASSMSVLKDDTTAYFSKWKLTFMKRFGDLIVNNQSNYNAGPSRQGQGGFRGGMMSGGGGRPQQQGTCFLRTLSSSPTKPV